MRDPIKVIHRYKNKHRRNQYLVYIFLGSLVTDEIKKILAKIEKLDFISTLLKLTKKDHKMMEEYYNSKWYLYLFPSAHIKYSIKNINSSASNRKKIIEHMGKEWFSEHIDKIPEKKKINSFAANYVARNITLKKISAHVKKKELDFRTYFDGDMMGGADDNEKLDKEIQKQDEEEEELTEEIMEEEVEETFNMEELANLYSMDNIEAEKSVVETTKLISEALKDKSWKKKVSESTTKLDDSDENLVYDSKIENIYKKIYIFMINTFLKMILLEILEIKLLLVFH